MGAFTWEGSFATGVLKSHALSKELRYAAVAEFEVAQFCRAEPGFGRKMGDTITITKIKNIAVPDSATLSEHEDIPIDTLSIGTTGITVSALGRGVEYTSLADELSFFDLKTPIQKKLRDQLAQVNDNLAATAFKTTYVVVTPTSATGVDWQTDGSANETATHNITVAHCGVIRDYMKDTLYVPPYEKGNYIGLGSTKLLRGIKNDPDFQQWRQWLRPGDVLFNSEVGMVEQIRWIEINNTTALANNKGSGSTTLGEGLVFGDDGVALAEVQTPELRAAIPGNFGRYQAVAWYGVLAYGLIWNATATAGEARVIFITSA